MKKIGFVLALSALWTSSAFAEERMTADTDTVGPAPAAQPGPQSAAAVPLDVIQPARAVPPNLCSRSDPYIEYRDCVNATTRDANAKVRMA